MFPVSMKALSIVLWSVVTALSQASSSAARGGAVVVAGVAVVAHLVAGWDTAGDRVVP